MLLAGVVVAALVVTGVLARAPGTWLLEVVWVLIGLPLVLALRKRFPLTRLLCWLLVLHALVLCYGGQYTYAETPLGEWVQDWLGTKRNDYDRLGHFVQGFVPAVAVREVLLRRTPLRPGGWVAFLTVSVCLAISACFEFVEWFSALVAGSGADAFLATQGDVWDTQWDMFLCLCGAVLSVLVWRRVHDRQLGESIGAV
jgi:putative membrane protein